MLVKDFMVTDLISVRTDATVAEALVALADAHVSALPVLDGRKRLVGVLSSTDILSAAAESASGTERELVFEETLVRDLMSTTPHAIGPGATLQDAAAKMLSLEVHRLLVEDGGQLLGVISQTDLLRSMAASKAS